VGLDQERGVAYPGDANFAFTDFRELRPRMIAGALGEERRDQDFGKEIALVPIGARDEPDAGGAFVVSAVLRGLANDIPPAFFRKRNRHGYATI
jgi:hypothetical protein